MNINRDKNKDKIKIGIALGGGAALGFAHVGVLKVLEDNKIKIDYVAGTSMGSVIGGLYASGMTVDEMREQLETFDIKKVLRLNVFNMLKDGIFSTAKIPEYFESLAKIKLLEETKIPFRCVAVDLHTGKPYIFKKGSFGEAIKASTAIPGLFKPVKKGKMLLIDGGIVNNVPYDIVKNMGADLVIAVDVMPKYFERPKINSTIKILMYSFGLMLSNHEIKRRENDNTIDCLIDVPSDKDEQDWSKEAINFAYNLGVECAQKNIDKIKKLIRQKEKQFKENL